MGARCNTGRGGPGPHTQSPSALDAPPSDPTDNADWTRLEQARSAGPAGAEARAIADQILAADPSLPMRLAALRARAEHALATGDDALVIATADDGLSRVQPADAAKSEVVVDLARLRLRALVRSGDPAAAVVALDDPIVQGRGGLDPTLAAGLRAIAYDRDGQRSIALSQFVQWRPLLDGDEPTARWVEHRIAALGDTAPAAEIAEALADLAPSPGRTCLAAKLGEPVPDDAPPWVRDCTGTATGVGVLLPRSGPFAAFADEHLAATLVASEVLADRGAVPPLWWHDSGGSTSSSRAGAQALLGRGVRVVVGPLGAKNVKAVAGFVDDRALMIVPGEGSGSAVGTAPSVELRVESLVARAQVDGRKRLVVLAPDNGYGRRAIKAARATAPGGFDEPVVVRTYPANTTSFAPILNPVMTALRDDAALLVPDTLARGELLLRQLARAGKLAARGDEPGLMVLTTAEGIEPSTLRDGRDVLEGVWVAPAGPRGSFTETFESAYQARQGVLPGDQAILVYHALVHAVTGQPGPGAGQVTRLRIEGGQLVGGSTSTEG